MKSIKIILAGKSNVGKSSLMNLLCNSYVSTVSEKKQTTRTNISQLAIYNDLKIIIYDTPGISVYDNSLLSTLMKKSYLKILSLSDLVIMMIDDKSNLDSFDESIISSAESCQRKILVILNKIDLIDEKDVMKKISNFSNKYDYQIHPMSIKNKQGIDKFYEILINHAIDNVSDEKKSSQDLDKLTIQEIIRGVINNTAYGEVAYNCAVITENFIESKKIFKIGSTIYVDKDNHKKIIIGKGGSNIKKIGIEARSHLENILNKQVHLDLHVKVKNNWKNDYEFLRELGYML